MKENVRFSERKQESIHCHLESDLYKYSAKRENGYLGGDPRRCVVYLVTTLVLEKRTQVAGLQMHTTTQHVVNNIHCYQIPIILHLENICLEKTFNKWLSTSDQGPGPCSFSLKYMKNNFISHFLV